MARPLPTPERIRDVLDYDPLTGIFRWKKNTGKKRMIGKIAGGLTDGRPAVRVDDHLLYGSRLAWAHTHLRWPAADIDHIDGDPTNNRLANLREATRSQNLANKKRATHNRSGVKGVHLHKESGKWRAVVRRNRRNHHVGLFPTKEEAGAAYLKAARVMFGEFATDRGSDK